jgi:hypothetical protein
MSWFKHRPRIKEPAVPHAHRTSSPILDEIKKKAAEAGPSKKLNLKRKNDGIN